ncbi:GDSL-type esterase/lipase family protein [Demequina sp. SYSU T00192]|uniref:GDSL-type esterase/lipase family protein n=1 Tax=Demequina litoralis TaxID=3051660 RepID=A0ABT8GBP1_9MICO|nr:GDSL-type esterase/lipase family protein [Demequina sp. SYSU T00192]MDN4476556.1 GDSL-type esterase/lipase family protein [Demequina sp. SYSU T00192]
MTGPRVVALGDSITLGVGDGVQHSRGDVGWAAHAARALGASSFTNLAANGVRARDMLAAQVAAASALRPDVVLLTVGGNDVLRGDFSPAEVERALGDAIDRLARPDRTLVTVSLDRIGLFDLAPARVADAMARRVGLANGAIARAAARTEVSVVDGATLLASLGRRAWHIDRIHPSPQGHRALAGAAVEALAGRWPQRAAIPAPPAPPGRVAVAAWLAVNGVPWAVKRSRDLIPQVTMVIARELREERRVARAGA